MSIVNLDKIQSSKVGNIESVVLTKTVSDAQIQASATFKLQNGMVCNLGALVTGETELKEIAVPATASLGTEEVLLIASPEVIYDNVGTSLKDFVIPQGTPCRAYHLTEGDIFTVTTDVVTGVNATYTTDVGKYLIPADGVLTLKVATDITGSRFAGKIIEATTLGYTSIKAFAVQVVKC